MSTRRNSATALGLLVLLSAVSVGVNSGSGGGPVSLLLSFTAVLAGVSLVAVGVRTADAAAASFPGRARTVAPFPRRGLALVGLAMASSAAAAVAGEADPALCFGCFVLLLLGISLIAIGVQGG